MNEPHSDRTGLIAVGIGITLVVCCLCIAAMAVCAWGVVLSQHAGAYPRRPDQAERDAHASPHSHARPTHHVDATPAVNATPSAGLKPPSDLRRDPVPQDAMDTARLLESADIPKRDLRDVTLRLADPGVPIPRNHAQPTLEFQGRRQARLLGLARRRPQEYLDHGDADLPDAAHLLLGAKTASR